MSDSGFSNLPPDPKIGPKAYPPARSEQNARIENISGNLERVARPVKLEGRVIERTAENRVRVRTEQGDVELILRGRPENVPRAGERVEITVERGRPPRQASIKTLPPEREAAPRPPAEAVAREKTPQLRETQPGSEAARPRETPPPARPVEPDIPLDLRQARPDPRPAPLPLESIVRLIPLPPSQTQEIIFTAPAETTPVRLPELPYTTALRAASSTQRAVNEQTQNLLTLTKSEDIAPLTREILPRITSLSLNAADSPPLQNNLRSLPQPAQQTAERFLAFITQRPPLTPTLQPQIQTQAPALTQPQPAQSPPQTAFSFTPGASPLTARTQISPAQSNIVLVTPPVVPAQNPQEPAQQTILTSLSAPDPATQTPFFKRLTPLPVLIDTPAQPARTPLQDIRPQPAATLIQTTGPVIKTLQSALTQQSPAQQTTQNPRPGAAPIDVSIKAITPPAIKITAPPKQAAAPPLQQITQTAPAAPPALGQEPQFTPQNLIRTGRPTHSPPPQILPRAESITARVIGHTPKQLPVLTLTLPAGQTSQPFTLQFQASNLPAGAQLELSPLPSQSGTLTTPANISAAAPETAPALIQMLPQFQWPALDDLGQAIRQSAASPQAAQAMTAAIPNPANPAQMPPAILMFIAAVRGGDISGWLNERTIDTLRRAGREDTVNRLSRDFTGINRLSAEPAGQDWRTMPLPMMWEGELHHIMLYYKHGERGDEDEQSGKGTRFIFDLSLDRMGPVQLDAFHRPGRLDLIVRTESPLSGEMQKRMRGLYINALEQAGTKGELSFQGKREKFVEIELSEKTAGDISV